MTEIENIFIINFRKSRVFVYLLKRMNNNIREMVRDKMKSFQQLGLSRHQQVLISLPSLFNYESNQQLASITGINKFVETVINKTFLALQELKISVDETFTKQILSTVWPFFIRPDPTKFLSHLKYLAQRLSLSEKHACFMIHYSKKLQNKYPDFCIKNTLQHFKVPQEQIKYDLLINVVVGQQCIDALLNMTKFNIHKQIISSQQNEFIQQELKPSAMTSLLEKLLSHKINVIRFIRQIKDEYALVRYLDQWLKLSSNDCLLNIFRALKIILVCQSLYQIKCQQESETIKLKQPIIKTINEVAHRFLNRLFNRNLKQKILILDWILQGKVWSQNQQLKNSLIPYLITCYELHKYKEQSRIKLVRKIEKEETKLVSKYLSKIKYKYFGPINFRLKVPKYYLKLNLGLVEQDSIETFESKNSFIKNTSGTVSLGKIGGGQSINLQYQNQTLTKCSFDKLIVSVFKYTQNIQLHIVYIILKVLQQELKMNPNQLKQSQTETQKTKQQQKYRVKPNNFMKLFYRVIKSLKEYSQIFQHNKLTEQINKIITSFAIYFQFGTIKDLHRTDLHDLQMVVNNDVVLENLANNLLRNTRYHALSTIYSVEVAQNIMNAKSISQNNNGNRMISNKKNKKQPTEYNKLDSTESQQSVFINTLGYMIQIFTKKQEEVQFLSKIALISDIKITQTLFLNLFYYLVLRTSRNSAHQKEKKTKISSLGNIFKQLFKQYFEKDKNTQKTNKIVKILATAHKIFENWRKSTRKSCSFNENQLNSWVPDSHQQQRNISQCYWRIMISNQSKDSNIMYAKHFQKANCIKESIYWMQMRHKHQFPIKSSVQQTQWLFNLHSRLEDHLTQCKPYVYNKLGKDTNQKQIIDVEFLKRKKNELKWVEQIKFLTNNLNAESYSSIVYNNSIKIWQFQETQEVDQTLHEIFVFCTYFQSIKYQNYSNLYENMLKLNNRDLCLSIVNCLNINKQTILNRELDKKKQQEKQCQILSIIYNQKLRYNELDDLQAELNHINVENMNVQQIRAAIILYSKIQQFDKVRLLFRYLKDCPPRYKQQLEFYNMQAIYKSTMMYPAEKMIQNLQKIIRYIEEQKKAQKLTKSSTNPLFESFKFICENYQHLTLEEEKKIVSYLNRYLKKVYECQNYPLSTEAAYFILRFILIQSTNSAKLSSINSIFPYQMYGASILQPHKQLLICSIGESAEKNNFIKKILVRIAENDPKASSWWIYGLKYHCQVEKKAKQCINSVDQANKKIGQQIYEELKKKYIRLDEQFEWISWLSSALLNADLKKIPDNMVSPFSKDVILQKVIQIQNLGHGKSKPIRIQFRASKNKRPINVYIIRKLITNYKSQFRTESATANFFKDCKLLDQQITYSIVHLAKYCLLVEHIEHKATLDFLLNNNIEQKELRKLANVMDIMKNNKTSVMSFAYDKKELELNFKLHQFFFSSSSTIIKSWWEKYRNFLKTYAQWCFLGYIVGLGDRHTNNILVTEQGRVIHIDFQYIFDSGKFLPFPEWVPFRLTRGLLSQVCQIEPYGILYSQFIKTAMRYKDKKRQIWHAESHFSFMKKKDMSNQINKRAYLRNRPFQEAQILFKRSSSKMLLRDMYYGWGSWK